MSDLEQRRLALYRLRWLLRLCSALRALLLHPPLHAAQQAEEVQAGHAGGGEGGRKEGRGRGRRQSGGGGGGARSRRCHATPALSERLSVVGAVERRGGRERLPSLLLLSAASALQAEHRSPARGRKRGGERCGRGGGRRGCGAVCRRPRRAMCSLVHRSSAQLSRRTRRATRGVVGSVSCEREGRSRDSVDSSQSTPRLSSRPFPSPTTLFLSSRSSTPLRP